MSNEHAYNERFKWIKIKKKFEKWKNKTAKKQQTTLHRQKKMYTDEVVVKYGIYILCIYKIYIQYTTSIIMNACEQQQITNKTVWSVWFC